MTIIKKFGTIDKILICLKNITSNNVIMYTDNNIAKFINIFLIFIPFFILLNVLKYS